MAVDPVVVRPGDYAGNPKKLIDEQVSAQVSGLKNKNSELLGKLKESTESLKRF